MLTVGYRDEEEGRKNRVGGEDEKVRNVVEKHVQNILIFMCIIFSKNQ